MSTTPPRCAPTPRSTTFEALRNVSLNPWRIGRIVAAALVILHVDYAAPHDHNQ